MIAERVRVRAMCDRCGKHRDIDLVEIARVKGLDYDLWGRRTRCRLTADCGGWNSFYFNGRGRFEPLRGP